MGMLEKLYQDVWSQVFAATWAGLRDAARDGLINPEMRPVLARTEADRAAAAALTAWDPAKAHEQMALRDSGAPSDDGEDRPHTAVAQLRELGQWLSRDGKGDLADSAEGLADRISSAYEVV